MAGLSSLKNLFVRRRPTVTIDADRTAAFLRSEPSHEPADSESSHAIATVESKPSTRKPTLIELQRSYDEVMTLVRRIGEHLDSQAARSEKLVELLDDLPKSLASLSELNRQNARVIEILDEYLIHSKSRDDELHATLGTIDQSSRHQTEVLGLIQQQFDTSTESAVKLGSTLDSVRGSLQELTTTNAQTSRSLSRIVDEGEIRDNRLLTLITATQKWIFVAFACSIAACLGAMGVALYAILSR